MSLGKTIFSGAAKQISATKSSTYVSTNLRYFDKVGSCLKNKLQYCDDTIMNKKHSRLIYIVKDRIIDSAISSSCAAASDAKFPLPSPLSIIFEEETVCIDT